MTQDEGIQLAELFRLLGEPNRLRLVVACLDGPRSVGELTEDVGVSQSLVSQHLRLLRAGRLLKQTRAGRNVFYELPDCHVRTMLTNMMDHVLEPEDHLHEE
ncbi:winged helix-turn-helix transcriptional regulator [Roseomonas aeriglobus]|nr:winged helix-turn-helix transcriptional regulator [Roseomonas aeriglobus]